MMVMEMLLLICCCGAVPLVGDKKKKTNISTRTPILLSSLCVHADALLKRDLRLDVEKSGGEEEGGELSRAG